MRCNHCGKEIDNHAFFCIHCKKRVESVQEDHFEANKQAEPQNTYPEHADSIDNDSMDIFSDSSTMNTIQPSTVQSPAERLVSPKAANEVTQESSEMQDPEDFFSDIDAMEETVSPVKEEGLVSPQDAKKYVNNQQAANEDQLQNPKEIQQNPYSNQQQNQPNRQDQQKTVREYRQAPGNQNQRESHNQQNQPSNADKTQMWNNSRNSEPAANKGHSSHVPRENNKKAVVKNVYHTKKKGRGLLFAVFTLIVVAVVGAAVLFVLLYSKDDITQLLSDAKEHIRQGEYVEAEKLYSQVLSHYDGKEISGNDISNKIQAHVGKSLLYAVDGEYSQAADAMKDARNADTDYEIDHWKAFLELADVAQENTYTELIAFRYTIEGENFDAVTPKNYASRDESFQKKYIKDGLGYASDFVENEQADEGLFEAKRILQVDQENTECMVLAAVASALLDKMESAEDYLTMAYAIDPDETESKLKSHTKKLDTESNENLQSLFALLESLQNDGATDSQEKVITEQDKQTMLQMLNYAGVLDDFTVTTLSDEDKSFAGIMLLSDSQRISLPVDGYSAFAAKDVFENNIKDLFGRTIQDPENIVNNGYYPQLIEYAGNNYYGWKALGYDSYLHSSLTEITPGENGQYTVRSIAVNSADSVSVTCEAVFVVNSSSKFGFNLTSQTFY